MERLILWIQQRNRFLFQVILLLISAFVILQFIPRQVQFFEYEKGKPWMHEDLIAPFTFSILKSTQELDNEKSEIVKNKSAFYRRDAETEERSYQLFKEEFLQLYQGAEVDKTWANEFQQEGEAILRSIYSKGIIEIPSWIEARDDKTIFIIDGVVSSQGLTSDYNTVQDVNGYLDQELEKIDSTHSDALIRILKKQINPNIIFDKATTEKDLEEKLGLILPTKGVVQENETVIFKGNIVDDDKLSKLNSLKQAYKGSFGEVSDVRLVSLGQFLIILIFLIGLYVLIFRFHPELLKSNQYFGLIITHITVVIAVSFVLISLKPDFHYAVPVLLLPIIFISFFDVKLSIVTSLIGVILIGFLVPNGFEFIVIQSVMVLIAGVSYKGFLKRAQFFISIGKILGVYVLVFISYSLMQEGSFSEIEYSKLIQFLVSALLGLFAIPLLYMYEKIFGLISETTLLELSDTNSKLLRELSEKAPGTFQHSLQVANLAEKGVLAIGGNALLTRTGAIYHDIGKMLNPQYFIENQVTGVNPHDELSFKESAQIIISHVLDGIEMAKKNKLPDVIIDFVRTHHGTTKVEYFYKMYLKNFPEDDSIGDEFTYPGPKPFTKEQAVLMMADSIEAASRSLPVRTNETLSELINKIVDYQINTFQFVNADITFRDITLLKEVFLKVLLNVYHLRVEYPK